MPVPAAIKEFMMKYSQPVKVTWNIQINQTQEKSAHNFHFMLDELNHRNQ